MKIIDLLNKIANGEEVPKKIEYDDKKFEFIGGAYEDEKGNDLCYYDDSCMVFLNDEVEIIEKKKIPKKINNGYTKQSIEDMKEARFNSNDMAKICNRIGWLMENRNELSNKIDEIIDYLKSKGE